MQTRTTLGNPQFEGEKEMKSSKIELTLKMTLLAMALNIASCGGSTSGGIGANYESKSENSKRSYDFTENGCKTESHTFESSSEEDSQRQMCEALQDNKLNHYCAERSRKWYFEQNCPGQTWNPKD